MILAHLSQAERYAQLHPLFPKVFAYIRATDLFAQAPGRYQLDGDNLIAIVERVPGRSRELAKLECHRRYIDIQLVLDGIDEMGWQALGKCQRPVAEYSAEKDIQFFDDTPACWVQTPANSFCIFFPEDAHAPLVSHDFIHKVIFKVAVSP